MRRTTLLAVTALTIACLGGPSLTAQAAPRSPKIIISYGSNCNQSLQNLLDKLQNCIPNITLPECGQPDTDAPETDAPEMDAPETDAPEMDAPETNLPDNNSPENNVPDNTPESDSSTGEHTFIKEVVDLVNVERAKESLAPLTINSKVQAAAQVRAKECEQLFSHTRPNGTSFSTALKEQNVSYRSAGENIAWGQKTPQEVVTAWMNSAGHRANIMNANFTTIGVGYYENARGTDYWCQLFTR